MVLLTRQLDSLYLSSSKKCYLLASAAVNQSHFQNMCIPACMHHQECIVMITCTVATVFEGQLHNKTLPLIHFYPHKSSHITAVCA